MMATSPQPGSSYPLGATVWPGGVNFSVYADKASAVELLLFDGVDDPQPAQVIRLDPRQHRTYHYWHAFVPGVQAGQLYAYRAIRAQCSPARPALRCGQGPARPLRPGGRHARCVQPRSRQPPRRQHSHGHEERRGGYCRLRLGGRPAAAPAHSPDGHLRDARGRLHPPPQLGRGAGEARHLCRAGGEDPLSAGPGHHGRRAAAGLPVRSLDRAAGPGQLLGLPAHRLLRAAHRLQLAAGPAWRARRVPRHGQGPAPGRHRGDPRRGLQPHRRGLRRTAPP